MKTKIGPQTRLRKTVSRSGLFRAAALLAAGAAPLLAGSANAVEVPQLNGGLPEVGAERARLHTIGGSVPPATQFPAGCRFHPRCPHAMQVCQAEEPALMQVGEDHRAACWLRDPETLANRAKSATLRAETVS